ncbi:MAG TPA: acyltransferase [Vitreimonas sp.]|nr:acyltransferase [Vitreimonas sp.]
MRGLAALAVITDHVPSEALTGLLPGRYLAVDFFFVLSGFVLAHVYLDRLRGGMTVGQFLRVRVIRLYPLYLAGTALGAVLMLISIMQGWNDAALPQLAGSLLFALFLLPCPPPLSIWPNAPYPLNGPAWSLFFELFVNTIFALAARWLTPAASLVFVALGGVLLVPTAFGFGQLDGGFAWSNFIAGFPRVTFSFFAGVWLYQVRAHDRLPALPAWAAYALLALVFMIPGEGAARALIDLFAVLIVFPLLVATSANAPAGRTLLHVSTIIGVLSYGVYILHVPLWGWTELVLGRFHIELPGAADVALAAIVALSAAAFLDAFYDRPLRRRLSRKRLPAAVPARD